MQKRKRQIKNTFSFTSELPVSVEKAYSWHLRKGVLERFIPPWVRASFLFPPGAPEKEGSQVGLLLRWGPFSMKWVLVHRNCIPNQEFTDVQIQGPFRYYQHCHRFIAGNLFSSKLQDEISYTFPLPFLNRKIEKELSRVFSWRHAILKADLKTVDSYPTAALRILLTGSSGFIGSRLKTFLQLAGHEVICLVRDRGKIANDAIFWDPRHAEMKKEDFEDFDTVIHLAGAGIAKGRWTKKNKEQLFLSRCRDTWVLSQVLSRLYRPPKTFICASAIGFYGDRGIEELTEESGQGTGFLADLCGNWEKSTAVIEGRGTRVIHTRFGVVLGAQGGMLRKMLRLTRLGLGGKTGTGEQVVSWIGIDDLLGGVYHCLMREQIVGAVNLVAPQPISQAEFVRLLAKKVGRPAFCHLPASFLKLALGDVAKELILASQNVKPNKLIETGYAFRYPDLKTALDFVM